MDNTFYVYVHFKVAWPSASIVVSSESHNEWIIANSHFTFMSTSKLPGHLQVLWCHLSHTMNGFIINS